MSAPRHLPALDGIRGFAVAALFAIHTFAQSQPTNAFETVLAKLSGLGVYSIDIFFVLSGFLITGILLDSKSKPRFFSNFLVRRALRIFPLYYAVLLIIFVGLRWIPSVQGPSYDEMLKAEPWAWTYTFNYYIAGQGGWTVPWIGHFWSLAVEEQFYLAWPLIVFLLSRRGVAWASAGLVVLGAACKLYMELHNYSEVAIHVFTGTRIGNIGAGAWLAAWVRAPEVVAGGATYVLRRGWMLLAAGIVGKIVIFVAGYLEPGLRSGVGAFSTLTWLAIFAAGHMAAFAASPQSLFMRIFTWRPFLVLGKYSYGVYLFHHFYTYPVEAYGGAAKVFYFLPHTLAVLANGVIALGLSTALAYVSYHVFEERFLKLKDKIAPSARKAPKVAPAAADKVAS